MVKNLQDWYSLIDPEVKKLRDPNLDLLYIDIIVSAEKPDPQLVTRIQEHYRLQNVVVTFEKSSTRGTTKVKITTNA